MGLKMVKVNMITEGIKVEVNKGKNLHDLCLEKESPLPFGCTEGNCGTCIIKIKSGKENLSKKTEQEKITLDMMGCDEEDHRLACQCKILGDIEFENGI